MGKNTETTGGTRFAEGKPNAVGTPILGLFEVFRVVERGAEKYALLDWEVGQSFKTLLNCATRHLFKCLNDPLARDEESGLLHAAHAAWNLLCLLHFVEEGRAEEMDDITKWRGVTTAMKQEMENKEIMRENAIYEAGYRAGADEEPLQTVAERIQSILTGKSEWNVNRDWNGKPPGEGCNCPACTGRIDYTYDER